MFAKVLLVGILCAVRGTHELVSEAKIKENKEEWKVHCLQFSPPTICCWCWLLATELQSGDARVEVECVAQECGIVSRGKSEFVV